MAANYQHIGGGENRLGRHYSRFSAFWPPAALADQSLALRKSQNAGSNRRSRASSAKAVALINVLSPIRTSPSPSASGRLPLLVSSATAVVIVRVYPAMLPPTIRMAPTSDIVRPNPANTAVSIGPRPMLSKVRIARHLLAPKTCKASPYSAHSSFCCPVRQRHDDRNRQYGLRDHHCCRREEQTEKAERPCM